MPDRIHLTVATVVHRDDRFLMVTEPADGRKVLNQPAGHVEPGEDIREAALRECLEETGWQVRLNGFLGIRTYTSPTNGITYYRVSFTGAALEQVHRDPPDGEITSADWLTVEQIHGLRNRHRSPLVLAVIEDYLAGAIYPLDLVKNTPCRDS